MCVCVCEQTGTAEHTTNCVKSLCDWNKTIVIEGPSTNFNWGEGRGGEGRGGKGGWSRSTHCPVKTR